MDTNDLIGIENQIDYKFKNRDLLQWMNQRSCGSERLSLCQSGIFNSGSSLKISGLFNKNTVDGKKLKG